MFCVVQQSSINRAISEQYTDVGYKLYESALILFHQNFLWIRFRIVLQKRTYTWISLRHRNMLDKLYESALFNFILEEFPLKTIPDCIIKTDIYMVIITPSDTCWINIHYKTWVLFSSHANINDFVFRTVCVLCTKWMVLSLPIIAVSKLNETLVLSYIIPADPRESCFTPVKHGHWPTAW